MFITLKVLKITNPERGEEKEKNILCLSVVLQPTESKDSKFTRMFKKYIYFCFFPDKYVY